MVVVTGGQAQRVHHLGDRTRHFHNLTDLAMDALRPDEAVAASTLRRGARPHYALPDMIEAGANVAMLQVCSCSTWRCIRAVLRQKKQRCCFMCPLRAEPCAAVQSSLPHVPPHKARGGWCHKLCRTRSPVSQSCTLMDRLAQPRLRKVRIRHRAI